MSVTLPTLDESHRWCARVTRTQARNFYWGLRLAPSDRRPDLYAAYAWMRAADDLADEPMAGVTSPASPASTSALAERDARLKALAVFRAATDAALAVDASHAAHAAADAGANSIGIDPRLWPGFVHAARTRRIDPVLWSEALDGMDDDARHTQPEDWPDLDRYCYRVASTVGLICLAIWGMKPNATARDRDEARRCAIARGHSFQLTNIARDVRVDALASRWYVPRSVMAAAGVSTDDLLAWRDPDACSTVIGAITGRARQWQRESLNLESLVDPACVPALRAMSGIYWSILDVLVRDPRRSIDPSRARLSTLTKARIMASALVGIAPAPTAREATP
jgi:phytoene synthase